EYNMAQNTFGAWTLVDEKNINQEDMRFITTIDSPHIYGIVGDKKLMIVDMPTLEALNGKEEIVTKEEMDTYEDGGTLVWTERLIN
ncbi:MAG: hypothetical protein KKH98_03750, partial [Spirochaetes bacterium]|nr:hypothetical protein [Spirochaetota bacterium]